MGGFSKTDIAGGYINWIDIIGNATATISGGQINNLRSGQKVGGGYPQHIELICRPGYQYNTTTKLLSGLWADKTAFNIQLVNDPATNPTIENIKFTLIPEPASMLLLVFGGLLIRRK